MNPKLKANSPCATASEGFENGLELPPSPEGVEQPGEQAVAEPVLVAQEGREPDGVEPNLLEQEVVALEEVEVLGLRLARMGFAETVDRVECLIRRGKPSFFITANLHYARLCERDARLQVVNRKAAFLTADGMPLVWLSRLLDRPLPERVTGADLVWALAERAAQRGWRVFLLGGGPGVAEQAATVLRSRYPGLRLVGVEAPVLEALSPAEHTQLLERIRQARPDLLLVAFGQPKGELWLAEHIEVLGVPAAVQIGGALDFVAGRRRRAPGWMRRIGLEWFWRLVCEPVRLGRRYLADGLFLFSQMGKFLRAIRPPIPSNFLGKGL